MRKKSNRFSAEVRQRAVRMVQKHRGEYVYLWAAVESIAPKISCVASTLLDRVNRDDVNTGLRDGITSEARSHQGAAA